MGAADQGLVFAVVGFAAGIVGTATSNGLLAVRKALDKNFESQNEAPNVLLNAGTWATHMGVSSNVRYQILNGIDMVRAQIILSKSSSADCASGFSSGCALHRYICHDWSKMVPL